ncbi:DUF5688 family protein [Roseburia hominis]
MEKRDMTYIQFVEIMQREVREQMQPEVQVELHTTMKNNSTRKIGLVLMQKGINMSPTIYMEEFYSRYLGGTEIPALVQVVRNIYEKVKVQNSYPFENILSFPKVKDKICYQLIQKTTNRQLLDQVPHDDYLDLAVVYYILLENTDFGDATLTVRNEHLHRWNVAQEEVAEAARRNTPHLLPLSMYPMVGHLHILTNNARSLGAAAILYPNALEHAYEMLGENFYILPSSIHEVILIPESHGIRRTQLDVMVKEVNANELEPSEVLSEHVYYYSGKEKRMLD